MPTAAGGSPLRVIQWSTGGVGMWALRQIIDRPDLELASVWVSNPAKEGKDAGDLCDRPQTGVLATRSREEIVALDADLVIHTARAVDDDGGVKLRRRHPPAARIGQGRHHDSRLLVAVNGRR